MQDVNRKHTRNNLQHEYFIIFVLFLDHKKLKLKIVCHDFKEKSKQPLCKLIFKMFLVFIVLY